MRVILICHDGALLDQEGLARWLASFSDLVGLVVLKEKKQRGWRRIRREIKRVGLLHFLDVLAFRAYYRLLLARRDEEWQKAKLKELVDCYSETSDVPTIITHSPNSPEAQEFIKEQTPDILVARCKTLLKEQVFSIPSKGTLVMHPGICPEYRNAHGCFWALSNRDLERVGMTLLRVDKGVDTGPIFGYYTYPFDEVEESHIVIQYRVVFENLSKLRDKFFEIYAGEATPLTVSGRASQAWGQPWLTKYLLWKKRARRQKP